MGYFCNRPLSLFHLLCYQQKQAEVKRKQCLKGFSTTEKFQRSNIGDLGCEAGEQPVISFTLTAYPMIRWSNCQEDARWNGHLSNCLTMILSLKKHFLKIKNLDISKRINLDLTCFDALSLKKSSFTFRFMHFSHSFQNVALWKKCNHTLIIFNRVSNFL